MGWSVTRKMIGGFLGGDCSSHATGSTSAKNLRVRLFSVVSFVVNFQIELKGDEKIHYQQNARLDFNHGDCGWLVGRLSVRPDESDR